LRRLAILAALLLASCTQPVIERYYYIETEPAVEAPVVEAPVVLSEYERWALYLVAASGAILYEEHCTSEARFLERKLLYEAQARADGNGEFVVAGRLYIPPDGVY